MYYAPTTAAPTYPLKIGTIVGEGNGTPLQYSCLENPMDGGAWQAAVHGVTKSQTRLSDFTFTFPFHALEKEMATHSSILAWRIPGTEEPSGLPSVGSHRVRQDWSDLAAAAAAAAAAVNIGYMYLFELVCSFFFSGYIVWIGTLDNRGYKATSLLNLSTRSWEIVQCKVLFIMIV